MAKARYHHGDLRNALLDAAARLAEKGPEAVTIRAAAKLVDVTPTAAYRHFAGHDELLTAVKDRAMSTLAQAMGERLSGLPDHDDPALDALARLGALGRGYVSFAVSEPGLFRTAFFRGGGDTAPEEWLEKPDNPFAMLASAIDDLVDVGYVTPQSRPMAELAAWAAVHGVACLLTDGPMAGLPDEQRTEFIERTVASMGLGLGDGPAAVPLRELDLVRSGHIGRTA